MAERTDDHSRFDSRRTAFEILCRVEEGAFADMALDVALGKSSAGDVRDRRLTTELVYGTLRKRGQLDFALSRFCRKPLEKIESRVLWLLRLGAYQILNLDRVPDRAAVNESVELARREGLSRATGFLNGVLRNLVRQKEALSWPEFDRDPLSHLRDVLSLPEWLARRWIAELGAEEARDLATAMLEPAPLTLRVNTLRISREDYLKELASAGHQAIPSEFAPEGVIVTARGEELLPGDEAGWYQVQDQASMLIAHLLSPEKGDRILDACAAPGGKTTHTAALSENDASILALDIHPRRVELIAEGARRLGCRGIETKSWDLTLSPDFLEPGSLDRVLVDAPCSGLGVLRRNPEIRWRRRPEDLKELARRQLAILNNVAPFVRENGILLYSLCTIAPQETTDVVRHFLAGQPEFGLEDLRETAPEHWRLLFDSHGFLRTVPHRHERMDAFFAARLRRR